MNRRRYGNKRPTGAKLLLLTICFWLLSAFGVAYFMQGVSALDFTDDISVAKQYVEYTFPSISRGSIDRTAEPKTESTKGMFIGMMDHAVPGLGTGTGQTIEDPVVVQTDQSMDTAETTEPIIEPTPLETVLSAENVVVSVAKPANVSLNYSDPTVIIYHTHSTEAYNEASGNNYRSLEENGTVREVGNALKTELEAKGINVIHNKTIHDNPSYNQSYNRSLETIKTEVANNPTAKFVIDLHRDAGKTPNVTTIDGKDVATFSIVVGTENPNKDALLVYANYVIEKANAMYPGIATGIIEKPHKYNEYVSDYYILLEVGNNVNSKESAVLCGQYFGNIMAAVIEDLNQ